SNLSNAQAGTARPRDGRAAARELQGSRPWMRDQLCEDIVRQIAHHVEQSQLDPQSESCDPARGAIGPSGGSLSSPQNSRRIRPSRNQAPAYVERILRYGQSNPLDDLAAEMS